jgi:hypothetical protein
VPKSLNTPYLQPSAHCLGSKEYNFKTIGKKVEQLPYVMKKKQMTEIIRQYKHETEEAARAASSSIGHVL